MVGTLTLVVVIHWSSAMETFFLATQWKHLKTTLRPKMNA
jgi:hypothetical protein